MATLSQLLKCSLSLLTLLCLSSCGGGSKGSHSTPGVDTFKVSGVNPPPGAIEVDPNTSVSVYFDQTLENQPPATALTLSGKTATVTGFLNYSAPEKSLVFQPQQRLSLGGQFRATVDQTLSSEGAVQLEPFPPWDFSVRDGQWQTNTVIDTLPSVNTPAPQLALDAAGNALVVWHQDDGTSVRIWSSYYDAETGWESAVQVESNNSNDSINPKVAMNAKGRAMVVWVQSDGTEASIWSSIREPHSDWGTAVLLESSDAEIGNYPTVRMDTAGNAVVLWNQKDGGITTPWVNHYKRGHGWTGADSLEKNTVDTVSGTFLALNKAGLAMALWTQHDGIQVSIWINQYDGESWAGPVLLEEYHDGPASAPTVALNDKDGAIAVWKQESAGSQSLWSRAYTLSDGWGDAVLYKPAATSNISSLSISLDNSGNAISVWRQTNDGINDTMYSSFSNETPWTPPAVLEQGDGNTADPGIAMDLHTGNAIAVWRQSKDSGPRDIWSRRFLRDTGWLEPQLLEHDESGHGAKAKIAINSSGAAMAAWRQWDGSQHRVNTALFH